MDPNAEFRRGDFFDLKKLDSFDLETMQAMIRCYQYWIAVTDCDGFRIDAAKHIPKEICRQFSIGIYRYAQSIGKDNFLLVGEITDNLMSIKYLSLFGSVFDRALTAVLDINETPNLMAGAVRGTCNPESYLGRYRIHSDLALYLQTGRMRVSVVDDHDMSCRGHKERFAAHNDSPHRYWQVAHVVGLQLTTPGIPLIYYGTEQAFDGSEDNHDYSIEPQRFGEDRYIRECMFGGSSVLSRPLAVTSSTRSIPPTNGSGRSLGSARQTITSVGRCGWAFVIRVKQLIAAIRSDCPGKVN